MNFKNYHFFLSKANISNPCYEIHVFTFNFFKLVQISPQQPFVFELSSQTGGGI